MAPRINHVYQVFFVAHLAKGLDQSPLWWREVRGVLASANQWSISKQFGIDCELDGDLVVPVAKRHFVSIELGVVWMDPKNSVPAHHVVERVFQTADSRDAVVGFCILGQQCFGYHSGVLTVILEERFASGRKGFHG